MKSGRFSRLRLLFHLLAMILVSVPAARAQTKLIRLRNAVLANPPVNRASPRVEATPQIVSGLFLIQFDEVTQPAWRAQLKGIGVTLLHYVPDDAFVARFDRVDCAKLNALSYVRWAGAYRPEYKLHRALRLAGPSGSPGSGQRVRFLVAPDVPTERRVVVSRLLDRVDRQTHYSFGAVVEGVAGPVALAALAQAADVLWIEPAGEPKLLDEVSSRIVGGSPNGAGQSGTLTQQLGFDGASVIVAVPDSGLGSGNTNTMHPDLAGRVDALLFYGSLTGAADASGHGTHVAGIIAGNGATGETDENGLLYGLGVAPNAHIVAQRIFDAQGVSMLPDGQTLTQDAVRAGAVIGSNSWGDDAQGRYDLNAAVFDSLTRDADPVTPGDQPFVLEFSVGNAGPGQQTIDSPAVAKNVIATGASQNNRTGFGTYNQGPETMADFSSRGPCEDGRIKPDLVAPGTWIASLQSAAATDASAWLPIDSYYQYQGGTSQAGPHVSGAAAVFVQYYRETHAGTTPSPALVKAALVNSAVDMDNSLGATGPTPNSDEGWGRVNLSQLIGSARRFFYVDQTTLLTTGDAYETNVIVASADQPLKITLTYTDPPGLPAAIPALVNDLDLEVVGPDGTSFHGNQFDAGESIPNATAADRVNNVEGVSVLHPLVGEYLVRVRARNVVEDARVETPAIDQDFALVVSGNLPLPGVGALLLDRQEYRAPDTIQLKLIDSGQAGQPTLSVLVSSTTETNAESVLLIASGSAGVFTGAVNTVLGPPVTDGRLQVRNGDQILVRYADSSPAPTNITASARVDLTAPSIFNLSVTNQFGNITISWLTDEPANSVIRYGTSTNLDLAVTNGSLSAIHSVNLANLNADSTYWYELISTDQAGNRATNDNGGALFTFVPTRAASILLVDGYVPDDSSTPIALTGYTDALDQVGVSYEVWNINQMTRSPGTNDLRQFPVVIWRINDSFGSDTALSPADQGAIQAYVNGGGSFFMASMELLNRLANSPFVLNTLHILSVTTDVGVPSVNGIPNDSISDGMGMTLDYSAYPPLSLLGLGPDFSDVMTISSNAAPIFLDGVSNRVAGLRFPRTGQDSAGRVVFLSFPFDAVPMTGAPPNNRVNLLRNVLSFLAPDLNNLSSIALDNSTYTIPALVTVEVGDAGLSGRGTASVNFFSGSSTNGQPIALAETSRRGLFRGSITLAPLSAPLRPGQLRAADGDAIWVTYLAASSNSVLRANATVDTEAAAITGLSATPDYQRAVVDWITSKPTDALVEFGESAFLGRTAYSNVPALTHQLVLPGLQPDHLYYFRVSSRDQAGNSAVDNNAGKLYTFRTLKPLALPWSDAFLPGDTNWNVVNGRDGSISWSLGPPENGLVTNAVSPPYVWGTNLKGDVVSLADTMLVGPPIEILGGNRATLRFSQAYDFTSQSEADIYEYGQLYVSTNNGAAWTQLAEFDGASAGWQTASIDLSNYLGQVIRLGWYYGFYTLAASDHPGWLIDDVSVSSSNLITGAIEITNNLSQAGFTIRGPLTQTGVGWKLLIANAPPGQYVVTFNPVPYYLTPPPQTNSLLGSNLIVFQGNYTFPDVNTNGISDLWEQQYFGAVLTGPPGLTDHDADGSSDLTEFLSGTDPTDPTSALTLFPPALLPNRTVQLSWPSVSGYSYRLEGSTNLVAWTPYSDWLRATNTNTTVTLPPLAPGANFLFRLQVRP